MNFLRSETRKPSIGCNAGASYSLKDGGQYFTDPPSLVFCSVGDRSVAVPFIWIAFHGEDI